MENVKEAFGKVKQDIDSIKQEVNMLREGVIETRKTLIDLCEVVKKIEKGINEINQKKTLNDSKEGLCEQDTPTNNTTDKPSFTTTSTYSSTDNYLLEPLKVHNLVLSTGNEGVPTDRQTDRQTHRQTQNMLKIEENSHDNYIDTAAEALDSLDNIKKQIRLKFKRLTEQEMKIFSTLYQLEEEEGFSDYRAISKRLGLTESSIRDYIGRLIKKGIPVDKAKINNKSIKLNVSKNLKKIVSLPTILQLRDL